MLGSSDPQKQAHLISIFNEIDVLVGKITAIVMLTTFLVVAWFMRKNPQQHIVTLWVCFFFFTVSLTIYYFTKA